MSTLQRRLFEKILNRDLQGLGDGGEFVVEDGPLAALDFGNLRLADANAQASESSHHVLLRDAGTRRHADALNGWAGNVTGGWAVFHDARFARAS